MKLVVEEPESQALKSELRRWSERATSVISEVEVPRAVKKADPDEYAEPFAVAAVAATFTIPLTPDIVRAAVAEVPLPLRSLDAIHLASALWLRDELGALITYDRRMIAAAHELGLPVLTPS